MSKHRLKRVKNVVVILVSGESFQLDGVDGIENILLDFGICLLQFPDQVFGFQNVHRGIADAALVGDGQGLFLHSCNVNVSMGAIKMRVSVN